MPQALATVLVGLLVVAVGLLGLVWLRWQYLRARPGLFPCVVVEGAGPKRRERVGLATFGHSALEWFARDSLSPGPAHRWPRQGLTIKTRPLDDQARSGWQVVNLGFEGGGCLLVISRGASSGLLSWIEAGPSRTDSAA
ncbi:MAG: DUF2550 domain-containing protein [Bifidobacteriaceae bacterium]|jgi:hypothetical protein|nr:DUF2550 domain-containing protein [Bifidobacteriaceae bacterium]